MLLSRFDSATLPAVLMLLGTSVVSAQDYPHKPIRINTSVVGGGSDFVARQLAQGITGPLGQPVVVDNRPPVAAAEAASKAPPDGYTVMVAGGTFLLVTLLQKMPYDPLRDFSPITMAIRVPNILVVHPSLPVKSVRELIALAKARPGELNYATGGTGSPQHLAGEMFKVMAGVNIVRISYKGGAAAVSDLMTGEVQVAIDDAPTLLSYVKAGKLKALAVTTAQPSALFPGLPTVASSGLPGYELMGMTGVYAPAKTPGAIINRLNQEIVRVLNRADVKERFLNTATEVVGNTPEEFAAYMKSELVKWGKVIKDAGIKVD